MSKEDPKSEAVAAVKTLLKNLTGIVDIAKAGMYDTAIYKQAEQVLEKVASIASEADKGILSSEKMESVVNALSELAHAITKMKAANPLISDELVVLASNAVGNANTALKLTHLALKQMDAEHVKENQR